MKARLLMSFYWACLVLSGCSGDSGADVSTASDPGGIEDGIAGDLGPDAAPEVVPRGEVTPDASDVWQSNSDTLAEVAADAVTDLQDGGPAELPPIEPEIVEEVEVVEVEVVESLPAKDPLVLIDETELRLPPLAGDSRYVDHGDFDQDGDEDLVLAVATDHNVLLSNDGSGHFAAAELPGGKRPTNCIVTVDLNGDGMEDLFVGNTNEPSQVLINEGGGSFVDESESLLGQFSYQVERVLPGDLDGDGDQDFVVLCSGSQQERLLLNAGEGLLTDETVGRMPVDSLRVSSGSLGSVDGNGPPDLVFTNFISSQLTTLWINDGQASFSDHTTDIQPAYESMGFDAVLVDLTGNGDLDLFEANLMNVQRVLLNNGAGKFTEKIGGVPANLGPAGDGIVMAADAEPGDINMDGHQDIFLACSGTTSGFNQNLLLLGGPGGPNQLFSPSPFAENGGDSRHSAAVDLDGDGYLEIVVVNAFSQSLLFWNN